MPEIPELVEKTMSLGLSEFHRGIAAIDPTVKLDDGQQDATLIFAGHSVRIVYMPLESVTLGKSLTLPRASVRLEMAGLGPADRERFLEIFETAFQRGGG